MPKIIISEKDLTRAGTPELLTNIVYVPGYSITGPFNTPTLCNNLNEFKNLFGDEPYRYKNNQTNINYGTLRKNLWQL